MPSSRNTHTLRGLTLVFSVVAAIGWGSIGVVEAVGPESSSGGDESSHFDEGLTLVEKGEYEEALAKFEAAARDLRDAVGADHAEMAQVRDWWSELGAGHELFSTGDVPGGPSTQPAEATLDGADGADTGVVNIVEDET